MKVFYKGYNFYGQFDKSIVPVEGFIHFDGLRDIAYTPSFAVLLVADNKLIYSNKLHNKTINLSINQFSCFDKYLLILNHKGNLFKLDLTDFNNELVELSNFGGEISKVSCGANISVAISKLGKIYNIPNELHFQNTNIIDVQSGREHFLLLDKTGNVYSFGRGSFGQLGHGCLDDEIEPKLIEALSGIEIKEISVGAFHSCALSKDGDLYSWGMNTNGQLGIGLDLSVMATPHIVDVEGNVTKIACGSRHTIALLDNKQLFGCGWNKYRQLKIDDDSMSFEKMTFLNDLSRENVVDIKCGYFNSMILCNSD